MSTTADSLYLRRRIGNVVAITASCATALFGLFFLGWILFTLAAKGLAGINWDLFTKMTRRRCRTAASPTSSAVP